MLVWRIENAQGEGPYWGQDPFWTTKPHTAENGCPEPTEDYLLSGPWKQLEDRQQYIFGFQSEEQLKRWFEPQELRNLKSRGFNIVQVEAERVVFGERQLAFIRKQKTKKHVKISNEQLEFNLMNCPIGDANDWFQDSIRFNFGD